MTATVTQPDLILHNGRFTTLDRANPVATAVAIAAGRFVAVGSEADVMPLAGRATKVVDLGGRGVLPGLIDNHCHVIRGGLNYNMELRWDGVPSLAVAMEMLKQQVAITPAPQMRRQPDRPAAREPERDDPLRDARERPEAAVRVSVQLDAPFHARTEPPRCTG
ncbi:N-substituted formamide deformylase precursor [Burkholderia cenocepacia]|uniref:amidohydrolase family protein n=1 Tax=Burkholderia cenocepacia TaxID=95486 RepID=UPI00186139D4|nr:amidohydrolase family protein [Burkholderia cenocepacia]QND99121.1 N-substituted formamide deformylase precursor [Burkholderia cenocepacia]